MFFSQTWFCKLFQLRKAARTRVDRAAGTQTMGATTATAMMGIGATTTWQRGRQWTSFCPHPQSQHRSLSSLKMGYSDIWSTWLLLSSFVVWTCWFGYERVYWTDLVTVIICTLHLVIVLWTFWLCMLPPLTVHTWRITTFKLKQ